MTILKTPRITESHKSWTVVVQQGILVVQARTAEGLKKNLSWSHRMAYSALDMAPFRIIAEVATPSAKLGISRFLVAVAYDREEVLKDWERIRTGLGQNSFLSLDHWAALYEQLSAVMEGSSLDNFSSAAFGFQHDEPSPPAEPSASAERSFDLPSASPQRSVDHPQRQVCEVSGQPSNFAPNIDDRTDRLDRLDAVRPAAISLPATDAEAEAAPVGTELPQAEYCEAQWKAVLEIENPSLLEQFALRIFKFVVSGKKLQRPMTLAMVLIAGYASLPALSYLSDINTDTATSAGLFIATVMYFAMLQRESVQSTDGEPGWGVCLSFERSDLPREENQASRQALPVPSPSVTQHLSAESNPQPEPIAPEREENQLQAQRHDGGTESEAGNLHPITVRALDLLRSEGWKMKLEKDGVEFRDKSTTWCNKKACWFRTVVEGGCIEDFPTILLDDPETKSKKSLHYRFDRLLIDRIFLKHMEQDVKLYRTCYKSPFWGIAPRDFILICPKGVYMTEQQQKQHGFVGVGQQPTEVFIISAIEGSALFPEQKGFQRGKVHAYAFIARRVASGVALDLVMNVDPCGKIPASVVDMTNSEQIEKIRIIREMMLEMKASRPPPPPVRDPQPQQQITQSANESTNEGASGADHAVASLPLPAVAETLPEPVERFINLYHSSDWVLQIEKNGVKLYDKDVAWCDKKALMFTIFVEGVTTDECHELFSDPRGGFLYDKQLAHKQVLREYIDETGNTVRIFLTKYTSPMHIITPRDTVTNVTPSLFLSRQQQEKHQVVPCGAENDTNSKVFIHAGFTDTPSMSHPLEKGYVRGIVYANGFMAQEVKGGIDITSCTAFDPCGWIPARAIAVSNGLQIDKMIRIKDVLQSKRRKMTAVAVATTAASSRSS